jgi:NAD(P)-dependent dehydrogenase (short-subunit alcohol dehydrogenase family)
LRELRAASVALARRRAHRERSAVSAAARRALVTGASSGIGAATARRLAAEGYRVALLARRAERLEEIARELPRPSEHLALACDVTKAAQLAAAVERAGSTFGGLDLLVNNAGIGYRARVEELEAVQLERLLATNVSAVLLACKAALPWLKRGERPVVVNVASVVGRRGYPTQAAYAASKAAVCSISESLRLEWSALGIAVCTLNPTLTRTEIFARQANPGRLADPDLAGAMDPDQVARAVLELDRHPQPERFLASSWRWLGALSVLAPRMADRALALRLGGANKKR